MTIVQKVKNILKSKGQLGLKELYKHLPEHTQASIRGNINRYIKRSRKADIVRVSKGIYKCVDTISLERLDENSTIVTATREFKVLNFPVRRVRNSSVMDNRSLEIFLKEGTGKAAVGQTTMFDITYEKDYCRELGFKKGTAEFIKEVSSKSKEEFPFEFNKQHLMDCREALARIKSESVDCVITDPAYRVISGGKPKKKGQPSGILSKNNGKIFEENDIDFEDWVPEIYRILKPDTHAYIMCNELNLYKLHDICLKVGFKIHKTLVWVKNNATPNRWYMANGEFTLFLRKGKAKSINNCGSKAFHEFKNILGTKLHLTEKPLELFEYYILNSTQKNDVLVEPFGGSAVLTLAGIKNDRNVLSFEKDPFWNEIANKRINYFKEYGVDRRDLLLSEYQSRIQKKIDEDSDDGSAGSISDFQLSLV